jgi:hypothetical protein
MVHTDIGATPTAMATASFARTSMQHVTVMTTRVGTSRQPYNTSGSGNSLFHKFILHFSLKDTNNI